ncbi:MAG: metal-sensitive transcriptional regulator [Patescibacteria group bacterium]|nr:metal-sensitive transcriptional regulator [Patescibacteria group bacterium]
MRSIEQRINILIGQLEGVKKMLNSKNNNCFDSVIQLKAIKSSISSLMDRVLEEEFNTCFLKECPSNKEKVKKIFSEVLKK